MQNESKRTRTRKVYQVIEKNYWNYRGEEVQVADAFSQCTHTCSSIKKAHEVLQSRIDYLGKFQGLVFEQVTNVDIRDVTELWECKKDYGRRCIMYIQRFEVI